MSYIPHEWTNGETVTASKLNHIEDGIVNGGGILNIDLEVTVIEDSSSTSLRSQSSPSNFIATITSHTWQEIYDAVEDGSMVISHYYYNNSDENYYYNTVLLTSIGLDGYFFITLYDLEVRNSIYFYASNSSDYPTTIEPSVAEK